MGKVNSLPTRPSTCPQAEARQLGTLQKPQLTRHLPGDGARQRPGQDVGLRVELAWWGLLLGRAGLWGAALLQPHCLTALGVDMESWLSWTVRAGGALRALIISFKV